MPPFYQNKEYMKKLLVVCPSRERPHRIMDMIKSMERTIDPDYTDLVVLLDKDDKTIGQYDNILPSWVKYRVYDRTNDETLTTEIINRAFKEFNNYEYYSVTNDDIVYKTKGWDKGLSKPLKISSGQDDTMFNKYGKTSAMYMDPSVFPITSVIDGDIVRALGWLQYPELRHSCGDNIWYWIARRTDSSYTNPSYHTDHISPYFGLAEEDETFRKSNAHNNMEDHAIYKEWLKYKCGSDLRKVFKLKRTKEKELCQSV